MIDLKIKTYPKIETSGAEGGIPYLDVDRSIVQLDFFCLFDEGVNISAKNDKGEVRYLCELSKPEAIQTAKMILAFFDTQKY